MLLNNELTSFRTLLVIRILIHREKLKAYTFCSHEKMKSMLTVVTYACLAWLAVYFYCLSRNLRNRKVPQIPTSSVFKGKPKLDTKSLYRSHNDERPPSIIPWEPKVNFPASLIMPDLVEVDGISPCDYNALEQTKHLISITESE